MRKEVLFAVMFGVILGGIILFGINLANRSVSQNQSGQTTGSQVTPTSTPDNQTLSIISPQNHSVFSEKLITLTGKSAPSSNLTIVSESDDLIIEAGQEGTFSAKINLIGGENTITVTELRKDNALQSETITVIQSSNLPE